MSSRDRRGWKLLTKNYIPKWLLRSIAKWTEQHYRRISKEDSPEEKLEQMEFALSMAIRISGIDGALAQAARQALAKRLLDMGRKDEAQLLFRESYAGWLRNRGPDDAGTSFAEKWLALSHMSLKNYAEAHRLLLHVYEYEDRVFGIEGARTKETKRLLNAIEGRGYDSRD